MTNKEKIIIPKEMLKNQMQALDLYFEASKSDSTITIFLENIKKKLDKHLESKK